jgi:hypothetical protein
MCYLYTKRDFQNAYQYDMIVSTELCDIVGSRPDLI